MDTRLTVPRKEKALETTVQKEIEALRHMTVSQLRRKHAEVFGEETRSHHKQHLFRRIAWRIQALAEGGLSERARRRALEIANDADLRVRAPKTAFQQDRPLERCSWSDGYVQNRNLAPTWNALAGPVEVTFPKLTLFMSAVIPPRLTRLKALNASTRSSIVDL